MLSPCSLTPFLSSFCSSTLGDLIPHYCVVFVKSFSCVGLFATPWIVAHLAPLSMRFLRQVYCSGLPFPAPGDLSHPGIEPASHVSCICRWVLCHSHHLALSSIYYGKLKSPPPTLVSLTSSRPYAQLSVGPPLSIFHTELFHPLVPPALVPPSWTTFSMSSPQLSVSAPFPASGTPLLQSPSPSAQLTPACPSHPLQLFSASESLPHSECPGLGPT